MNMNILKTFMLLRVYDNTMNQKGYIALISVMIIGAIGAATAVSLLLLGLNSSRTSLILEQSNQAKAVANACAEIALQNAAYHIPYNGSDTITLGQGSCDYSVITTGNSSDITVIGAVNDITRKIQITTDNSTSPISITFWKEVDDF